MRKNPGMKDHSPNREVKHHPRIIQLIVRYIATPRRNSLSQVAVKAHFWQDIWIVLSTNLIDLGSLASVLHGGSGKLMPFAGEAEPNRHRER